MVRAMERIRRCYVAILYWGLFGVAGCSTSEFIDVKLHVKPLDHAQRLPASDIRLEIPHLSQCTAAADDVLSLNRSQPVTLIVHGCYSSAAKFRALADIYAFHGQQTVCFNYDDRDRLETSAEQLARAVNQLTATLNNQPIDVIGHSQGGLVARRAFTEKAKIPLSDKANLRLVTISTPFAGIEASSHCGSPWISAFSLGISNLICQMVTGSKWREIPPNADFIQQPGSLLENVKEHLRIATDERNSCRTYNDDGLCVKDDFVFSLNEQVFERVDKFSALSGLVVQAGHAEIVGDENVAPVKLIATLQQHGYLNQTPLVLADAFNKRLKEWY